MKTIGIISTAMLSLLLGIAGPAYAQHEGEKQDHPKQEGGKQEQSRPAQQHAQPQPQQNRQQQPAQQHGRQGQARPAQQAQPQPQQNRQQQHAQQQQRPQPNQQQNRQEQARPQQQHVQRQTQPQQQQTEHAQQRRGNDQPQRNQERQRIQHSAWDGHRSQHWDRDHRNWQQRGGYRGYRIPDDRFRGYFGSEHGFRIHGLPFLVVGGYPRFQYDGYWLSLVDPWPESWGNDWYDNDDVYISYDNGYYLYNRRYPATGIAISISR